MWGWFFKHRPTGPFQVSARDLSYLRGDELTPYVHLVGRIFYPTAETRPLPVCFWLPHRLYAYGYVNSLLYPERFQGWKYSVVRALLKALVYVLGSTSGIFCSYDAALIPPQAMTLADVNGKPDADGSTAYADEPPMQELPVIIFSHGLSGNRNTYSCLCTELASRGYLVLSLEHCDGTASAARLAGHVSTNLPGVVNGWRFYDGWSGFEVTYNRTRWRVKEVMTAYRLLDSLSKGEEVPGLRLSGMSQPQQTQFLAGRLAMQRAAVMGHSYGGATAALAASEHPELGAAIALDPWWGALPPESGALNRQWKTGSPVLIIGSQDWNTPDAEGKLRCGGDEQEAVLAAAAAGNAAADKTGGAARAAKSSGPGALLLVPRGSTHASFDDVLLFFGKLMSPVLKMFNFQANMPAERALELNILVTDTFLKEHLPLKGAPIPFENVHTDTYRKLLGADLQSLTEAFTP